LKRKITERLNCKKKKGKDDILLKRCHL